VHVGKELLELALRCGARSLCVVGTGKNVGKTVAMRAAYEAGCAQGLQVGLASAGLDGEAADQLRGHAKPRIALQAGTLFATAQEVLPRSPASEILAISHLQTGAGALVYVRAAERARYELIGPPTASGLREVLEELAARAEFVIADGAIDRVAALAGGRDAIVVACGAAAATTMSQAVEDVSALVQRLGAPRFDSDEPAIFIEGALTPTQIAGFIGTAERRQIVVRDPTQIALRGRAAAKAFETLRIRCARPLRVIAVTTAAISPERSFEPDAFARAVAAATRLPTFDVYAGRKAA
jgi:hypothetical protein